MNLLSGTEIYYPLSVLERVHIVEAYMYFIDDGYFARNKATVRKGP